jgi:CheY-like chemotaxis protein
MPKINGAAAAVALKRLNPETPIILFTRYEDTVDTLAPVLGVDAVSSKPCGLSNLIERARGLLQQPWERGGVSKSIRSSQISFT